MQITQEMLDFIPAGWDDDDVQDVWVVVLQKPDDYMKDAPVSALLCGIHGLIRLRRATKEASRRELMQSNIQAVEALHGTQDTNDPVEYLEAEELLKGISGLSDALRYTVERVCIDGATITEVAKEESVSANNIYQRIWKAKKELTNVR